MACAHCRSALFHAARGLTGAGKALIGIDRADSRTISDRLDHCRSCSAAVPCRLNRDDVCWCGPLWDGLIGASPTCGCAIKLKVKVAGESCPLGKW